MNMCPLNLLDMVIFSLMVSGYFNISVAINKMPLSFIFRLLMPP